MSKGKVQWESSQRAEEEIQEEQEQRERTRHQPNYKAWQNKGREQ